MQMCTGVAAGIQRTPHHRRSSNVHNCLAAAAAPPSAANPPAPQLDVSHLDLRKSGCGCTGYVLLASAWRWGWELPSRGLRAASVVLRPELWLFEGPSQPLTPSRACCCPDEALSPAFEASFLPLS